VRRKEGTREDDETKNPQPGGTRSKLETPDRAEPQSGNLVLSPQSWLSSSIKMGSSPQVRGTPFLYTREYLPVCFSSRS